jgi:hypothetical protein
VDNAIKAAKEAERARRKGKDPKKEDKKKEDKKKEDKKKDADEKPRKKLLGLVEFSVELNPAKPEPEEGEE